MGAGVVASARSNFSEASTGSYPGGGVDGGESADTAVEGVWQDGWAVGAPVHPPAVLRPSCNAARTDIAVIQQAVLILLMPVRGSSHCRASLAALAHLMHVAVR